MSCTFLYCYSDELLNEYLIWLCMPSRSAGSDFIFLWKCLLLTRAPGESIKITSRNACFLVRLPARIPLCLRKEHSWEAACWDLTWFVVVVGFFFPSQFQFETHKQTGHRDVQESGASSLAGLLCRLPFLCSDSFHESPESCLAAHGKTNKFKNKIQTALYPWEKKT